MLVVFVPVCVPFVLCCRLVIALRFTLLDRRAIVYDVAVHGWFVGVLL